jgi:S-adenosylmethionine hydrolase
MSKNNIIALLTDFGVKDVYVGVMKATIARINRDLQTIDLTHDIPPQNIAAARFCLMDAHPYLPENTVCLAVVDPGVGSKRRAIAIELENSFLVGADNGLFSGILDSSPPLAAVELTNSQYWRSARPSRTFHGRDIFAPVAAHLASGVPLKNLGKAIAVDSLVRLDIPEWEIIENNIFGSIQYVDRFGNLVTNIPHNLILDRSYSLVIDRQTIFHGKTYSDVAPGEIVTLVGSHGWLEIAINGGNAQQRLQLDWGDRVSLHLEKRE